MERQPSLVIFEIFSLSSSFQAKEKANELEEALQETPTKSKLPLETEHPEEGVEEEEEEEEELLGKFEKELEDILLPKTEIVKLKEEVTSEMEKEFDHIIDEARSQGASFVCLLSPPALKSISQTQSPGLVVPISDYVLLRCS